jgi:hypothetical protein
MNKFIPLTLILLSLAASTHAEVTTYLSASTAGEYLAVPAGARPAGLGNAFTGVRGDLNSLYWNPAGLLGLTDHRIMLGHHAWLQGISVEQAVYGQPLENFGAIGVSLSYLNYGTIERWNIDASGNPLPTGDSYTPYVISGSAGWAVPVGGGFAAGAALKLANEQIDNSGSLAGGLDLGVQFTPSRDLTLGAALRNVGLAAGEQILPLLLGAGLSYNLPYSFSENDLLTLLADVKIKYDDLPLAGLGCEYTYTNLFQIRVGWDANFGHTDPSRLGLTAGAGVIFHNWTLDYALASQGNFGLSQQVSLQYGF